MPGQPHNRAAFFIAPLRLFAVPPVGKTYWPPTCLQPATAFTYANLPFTAGVTACYLYPLYLRQKQLYFCFIKLNNTNTYKNGRD
jgi:hypothetical protein